MNTVCLFISLLLVNYKQEDTIVKKEIAIKSTKIIMERNFTQISVKEFKEEMQDKEKVLLDVRTPWEILIYGKLRENQILIDINNPRFASEISKLDKSKKYLIYCWHGNRSVIAREYMKSQGFIYAKDLEWGIDLWEIMWEKIIK